MNNKKGRKWTLIPPLKTPFFLYGVRVQHSNIKKVKKDLMVKRLKYTSIQYSVFKEMPIVKCVPLPSLSLSINLTYLFKDHILTMNVVFISSY